MLCHTCRHFYSKTELLRLSCFLRSCVSCTGIQRVEVEFMQNKVNCNALCIQISGLFSSYTSATKFCAFQTKQSLDGYYHNVINTAFVLCLKCGATFTVITLSFPHSYTSPYWLNVSSFIMGVQRCRDVELQCIGNFLNIHFSLFMPCAHCIIH